MNLFESQASRHQAPFGERLLFTDLNEEFSLPDYQPEMKRLLRVRATVMPPDRYIGSGSVECAGTVEYSVLYAGNDGLLYCTVQSGGYRFVSPVELPAEFEAGEGILCDTETVAEQVSGRVVAPRKLSLKCRLRSTVRLYGMRLSGGSVTEEDGVERLCGETEGACLYLGMGEELALADEILCEEGERDLRVVCADGQVFITDAVSGSGCVNCRGELVVKLLCVKEGEDGGARTDVLTRRIPFSQSVTVDGAEVNCDACATGICRSLQVTVEEGKLLCDATVCLSVKATRQQRISYLRDVYSTKRSCETAYTKLRLPRVLRTANGNMTLNTAIPLEEVGIRRGLQLVDLTAVAAFDPPIEERDRYRMNGVCRFHAVLNDGEEFSSREFEVPFKYETDGGKGTPTTGEWNAEVVSCRGRIDGERIGVDAEIAVVLCVRGEVEIEALSEARLGEERKSCGSTYRIYYPEQRDTLWSVAKQYCCRVNDLAERNRLAGAPAADSVESLAGVKYLLIS